MILAASRFFYGYVVGATSTIILVCISLIAGDLIRWRRR